MHKNKMFILIFVSGATSCAGPIRHSRQNGQIIYKGLSRRRLAESCFDYLACPCRQIRINLIVNPLSGTPICHNSIVTKHRKMTGYLGLYKAKRMDELAHAQLTLLLHQHQAAEPGVVR